jgi:hypothetical protein
MTLEAAAIIGFNHIGGRLSTADRLTSIRIVASRATLIAVNVVVEVTTPTAASPK